jgi:hypothetical protein
VFDGKTGTVTFVNGFSTGSFTATAPYSLTEVLHIHFATAGSMNAALSSNAGASFSSVPEPSSMVMAGLGAVGFIAYGWSRHRRDQRRQAAA